MSARNKRKGKNEIENQCFLLININMFSCGKIIGID